MSTQVTTCAPQVKMYSQTLFNETEQVTTNALSKKQLDILSESASSCQTIPLLLFLMELRLFRSQNVPLPLKKIVFAPIETLLSEIEIIFNDTITLELFFDKIAGHQSKHIILEILLIQYLKLIKLN